MKLKIRRIVTYAISTAISFSLIACKKESNNPFKEQQSIKFNEAIVSGSYVNVIENKSDSIKISDDQIQFENFDINELAEYFEPMLNDCNLDKEKFCEIILQPYTVTDVYKEESKGAYRMMVPLFGNDVQASYTLHYDNENKFIMFRKDTYKLQTENDKNESN